jgi:hypothetical protein
MRYVTTSRSVPDHRLAGLVGHERKVGEAVLESGLVRKKGHGKLSMIWLLLAANAPLLAELDFI